LRDGLGSAIRQAGSGVRIHALGMDTKIQDATSDPSSADRIVSSRETEGNRRAGSGLEEGGSTRQSGRTVVTAGTEGGER